MNYDKTEKCGMKKCYWLRCFADANKELFFEQSPSIKEAIYQLEKGKEGTLHWQCYVSLHKAQRMTKIAKELKLVKGTWFMGPILPKIGELSNKQAISRYKAYCQKKETRIRGPFFYPATPITPVSEIVIPQQYIDSINKTSHDRETKDSIIKKLKEIQFRQNWIEKQTLS